ncbi:MAG: maleylpyruvate isomerase family mycothiol-dependent enzyme [Acidimicrobiales bacterium]
MNEILAALAEQHAELAGVIDPLTDAQWATATPRCPGWTIADVVLHLSQTDEMALASVQARFHESLEVLAGGLEGTGSVDDGAAAMVESERGAAAAEVKRRWSQGASSLRVAFAEVEPGARLQWVVGDLAARSLATTRLAECWIHTGDVLDALGQTQVATDRLRHIARLAWRTLPYAFARAGRELSGPVEFDLTGPGGVRWRLALGGPATTVVSGPALDLCHVAGQRADAADTDLVAVGPDSAEVLALVRTFA